MANHVIVCVGGTGQIILHYYAQLYLSDRNIKNFKAIVIDTDDMNKSLQHLMDFFALLQDGDNAEVSEIIFNQARIDASGTACDLLTGMGLNQLKGFHTVQGFFDKDTLAQQVRQGMFARPALSSILNIDPSEYTKGLNFGTGDTHVTVVGSIIGGTGGGLIAPVIATVADLARTQNANVSIRGIFFGDYFEPERQVMPDADKIFPSNKLLVCKSLSELSPDTLRMYLFVEPTLKIKKQQRVEADGERINWPDSKEHPYWIGTTATNYTLKDTTRPQSSNFLDKEITDKKYGLEYGDSLEKIKERFRVVDQFVKNDTLNRIFMEPFRETIWKNELPRIMASYYSAAATQKSHSIDSFKKFVRDVMDEVRRQWDGSSGNRGLRRLFPNLADLKKENVDEVRFVDWGEAPKKFPDNLFVDYERGVRLVACTLLFRALRGSRA